MMMIKNNTPAFLIERHTHRKYQTYKVRTCPQYSKTNEASNLTKLSSLALLEDLLEERTGTDRRKCALACESGKDRRCTTRRKIDRNMTN